MLSSKVWGSLTKSADSIGRDVVVEFRLQEGRLLTEEPKISRRASRPGGEDFPFFPLVAKMSQKSSSSLPSFKGTFPPLDKVSTTEVNGGPWLEKSNQVLLQTLAGGYSWNVCTLLLVEQMRKHYLRVLNDKKSYVLSRWVCHRASISGVVENFIFLPLLSPWWALTTMNSK